MRRTGWLLAPLLIALSLVRVAEPVLGEAQDDAGPVRFSEHLIQDKYGYSFGVAAADLDGDGHLDLTSVDTVNDAFYWFAGDGKGNFTKHFIGKKEAGWLERHAIGDIDRDGHPDVVCVKNLHAELVWYQNPGKPRQSEVWKRHVITTNFKRSYDVAIADLDGDGHPDVAASAWNGNQMAWFRNPGKPEEGKPWEKFQLDTQSNEARTIRAGDFNGDGKLDLLGTATSSNLVMWYENPGKLGQPWTRHVIDDKSIRPTHGHPVDMDGDGDLDVVMAIGFLAGAGTKNSHQVVWYENVGKPGKGTEWKKHVIGELDSAFEAFAADLNGDGKLDIVATAWAPAGKVVWFHNPGDPKTTPWKRHVLKENWARANQVICADLNKDGRMDIIACAERGANELRWWRNEGPRKGADKK